MKDKEYLEKHIKDLQQRLAAGDTGAQMEIDAQSERLRDVDGRLKEEFSRGEETGRLRGITLGKKQAQTEYQQTSADYEGRLAKYEARLKESQRQLSAGDPVVQGQLQELKGKYSALEAQQTEAAREVKRASQEASRKMEAARTVAATTEKSLRAQLSKGATTIATAEQRVSTAEAAVEAQKSALLEQKTATSKQADLARAKQATIDQINNRMTSEIKSQADKNAQTIAAVKQAASDANKHAVEKAQARYELMLAKLDDRLKAQDKQIAEHAKRAR